MKIVLFLDDGRPTLGVALSAKKERYRVLTTRGREVNLPCRRQIWSEGEIGSAPPSRNEVLGAMEAIVRRASQIVPDLESLWELVSDETDEFGLEDLADLCFDSPRAPEVLALLEALSLDSLLFRSRAGRFLPRSARDVEETKRRAVEADRAREERREALARTRDLLEGIVSPEDVLAHPGAADLVEGLRARLIDGPTGARAGEADLASALGLEIGALDRALEDILIRLGLFRDEVHLFLARRRLPTEFPEEVIAETEEIRSTFSETFPDREDLTGVETFTIDDEGAEDLDDALSLEPSADGWRLGIHIASPAFFVPRGGSLDEEAYARGTTIYLPDLKVGMFPAPLAHDLMSLVPGRSRPALTVEVELSRDLRVGSFRLIRSFIRSSARLTYEEADELIATGRGPGRALGRIVEAAAHLRDERMRAGAVEIARPEVKVRLDPSGQVHAEPIDRESASRRAVGDMMILANRLAARYCVESDLPAIFRRQDPPHRPIPRADIEQYNPIRYRTAVRRLARARIGTIPDRHAGIGVAEYLQMTSPIRRYADLVIQRQIETFLTEGRSAYSPGEILEVVATADETAFAAARAEWERNRYWLLAHMAGRIGERVQAYLIDQGPDGSWEAEMEGLGLPGRLTAPCGGSPGDLIEVTVAAADPDRRRLEFAPVPIHSRRD